MVTELALSINNTPIPVPSGVPHGGLFRLFGPPIPGSTPPSGQTTGQDVIQLGIEALLMGVILLSLAYLIRGGYLWIMSQGDKQKIQLARDAITYSLLGLTISFLSFLAISIIGFLFNVPFI